MSAPSTGLPGASELLHGAAKPLPAWALRHPRPLHLDAVPVCPTAFTQRPPAPVRSAWVRRKAALGLRHESGEPRGVATAVAAARQPRCSERPSLQRVRALVPDAPHTASAAELPEGPPRAAVQATASCADARTGGRCPRGNAAARGPAAHGGPLPTRPGRKDTGALRDPVISQNSPASGRQGRDRRIWGTFNWFLL